MFYGKILISFKMSELIRFENKGGYFEPNNIHIGLAYGTNNSALKKE